MTGEKADDSIRVFIDEPIENMVNDEFGHRHYVKVLKKIIDNCQNEQLNIGLFGKWGVGKTTILNLLKNEIVNSDKYQPVLFGCWKYSNEPISIKRKFLLEVARQIGKPDDKLIESLYVKENRQISNLPILKSESDLKKSFKEMLKGLLLSSFIVLLAEVLSYFLLFRFLNLEGQTIMPLFYNAVFAGIFYYVIKILINYTSNVTITKSNENLESMEQFERGFQEIINKFNNEKKKKIIVLVDDLDRCQSKKVIEVLETIKTFINIKNCIFVIACDDRVLKDALIEERINDSDYLDKIFQIKLTILEFRQEKIREYAMKLLSSIDGVSNEELKDIVHVLIYNNVVSPRKVKILVNNFILLHGIFKERLKDNYFSANFTVDLKFLAKITVLQTEFTRLYYDLVNNNRLLEYIERVRRGDRDFEQSQINILEKYYETGNGFKVRKEFKQAINYLYYTSNYIISREHIKTYIYLSQDALNIAYSDEYAQNIENLILNKDIRGFVDEISKTKSQAERTEIFNNLLLRIDKYESVDMVNSLCSLSNSDIVNLIPEDIKRGFAVAILNRIQQHKDIIKQFDISGIEAYISITGNYGFYSDIIDQYVNTLTPDDLNYSINVIQTICMNSNLIFNISALDSFLVNMHEENSSMVLEVIDMLKNNPGSLEKYFTGNIFKTIMDCRASNYSDSDKKIIAIYMEKISNKLIESNPDLLIEKTLKFINDSNQDLSSACIEIVNSIINSKKKIRSNYAAEIVMALSHESNKWVEKDCKLIFALIIKIGEENKLEDETKENLVSRLCKYYIDIDKDKDKDKEENHDFINCYINAVSDIARVYGNTDKIVQNIIEVINHFKEKSGKCENLTKYIDGVKEYINSTHRNNIMQSILNLLKSQKVQADDKYIGFLYSILRQCPFLVEREKARELSIILINIADAHKEESNPVDREILIQTCNTYEELMYLRSFSPDMDKMYFARILCNMEDKYMQDFAVNRFLKKYRFLSDNIIRKKILPDVLKGDYKGLIEAPQSVIDVLLHYGSAVILELLDEVFSFIDTRINENDKINTLFDIISKIDLENKDNGLKILISMYKAFDKEAQINIFEKIFDEEFVRCNAVNLFIEGRIDIEKLYTLKIVSEKTGTVEERKTYFSLIKEAIENASSEEKINNLLQLFAALKDEKGYLEENEANDIVNNTFISLLEDGLPRKKAAIDTLTLYYNQQKFPEKMILKLAERLNNIIKCDEKLKEKAIKVVIASELYKNCGSNANELINIVKEYQKTG